MEYIIKLTHEEMLIVIGSLSISGGQDKEMQRIKNKILKQYLDCLKKEQKQKFAQG